MCKTNGAASIFIAIASFSSMHACALAQVSSDKECEYAYEGYVHDQRLGATDGGYKLIGAAAGGDLPEITRLLKIGISANHSDNEMMTPLAWAARCGRLDAVKLLMKNGAKVNLPISFEVNWRYRHRNSSALIWAASNNHKDVVQYLLASGADPCRREKVYKLGLNPSGQEIETYYAPGRRADDVTDDPSLLAILRKAIKSYKAPKACHP